MTQAPATPSANTVFLARRLSVQPSKARIAASSSASVLAPAAAARASSTWRGDSSGTGARGATGVGGATGAFAHAARGGRWRSLRAWDGGRGAGRERVAILRLFQAAILDAGIGVPAQQGDRVGERRQSVHRSRRWSP